MAIVKITGGMLRAARSLAGLSQQEVADRAAISRPCLTAWEGSSGAVPNANSGRESGVFSRGMAVDTKGLGHGIGCLACRDSLGDLLP
jgi:hypothetical protein